MRRAIVCSCVRARASCSVCRRQGDSTDKLPCIVLWGGAIYPVYVPGALLYFSEKFLRDIAPSSWRMLFPLVDDIDARRSQCAGKDIFPIEHFVQAETGAGLLHYFMPCLSPSHQEIHCVAEDFREISKKTKKRGYCLHI